MPSALCDKLRWRDYVAVSLNSSCVYVQRKKVLRVSFLSRCDCASTDSRNRLNLWIRVLYTLKHGKGGRENPSQCKAMNFSFATPPHPFSRTSMKHSVRCATCRIFIAKAFVDQALWALDDATDKHVVIREITRKSYEARKREQFTRAKLFWSCPATLCKTCVAICKCSSCCPAWQQQLTFNPREKMSACNHLCNKRFLVMQSCSCASCQFDSFVNVMLLCWTFKLLSG